MIPGCKLWLDSSFQYQAVKSGNAAQIVAANLESLSIADATQTGLDPLTSDFAIAAWVYADSFTAIRSICGKGATADTDPNAVGYWVFFNTDGTIDVRFGEGGQNRITINGTTVLSTATWYFVVINFDRDGNAVTSVNDAAYNTTDISSQPGSIDSAQAFRIGSTGGGGSYMDGRIQNALFLNRLLTATEITYLFNTGSGKRFEDLGQAGTDGVDLTVAGGIVSGWKLGEESGQRSDFFAANHLTDNNTVTQNDGVALVEAVNNDYVRQWTDLSGNGYHATQTGNVVTKPQFKTDVQNGKPGIKFDGATDVLTSGIQTGLNLSNSNFTVVGVLKTNTTTGQDFLVNFDLSGNGYQGQGFFATSGKFSALYRSTVLTKDAVETVGTFAATTPYVLTQLVDGTNNNLYVNGLKKSTATVLLTFTQVAFELGKANGLATMDGHWLALVVYNRALNAGELARITRAFGRRFGIAVT